MAPAAVVARGLRKRMHDQPTPLYLQAGLKLSFDAPQTGDAAFEEYVSDPAKPVPFRARPIQPVGYERRFDLGAVAGG